MNNRYLYRAKRVDNREWVEGQLFQRTYDSTGEVFEAHIITDAYEQLGVMNLGNQPVLISPVHDECFRIDPSTICQRVPSGGCSLDEKPIWESDIVTDGRYIGVVRFGLYESKHLGFYIEWMNGNDVLRKDLCYWLPKIKAIGNIFDNPELLEVDHE